MANKRRPRDGDTVVLRGNYVLNLPDGQLFIVQVTNENWSKYYFEVEVPGFGIRIAGMEDVVESSPEQLSYLLLGQE